MQSQSGAQTYWRKCSSCKKEIRLNGFYYVCSVSTCRQKKTDYVFCNLECWDRHIPVERHRGDSASAIEKRAPSKPEVTSEASSTDVASESGGAERRRILVGASPSSSASTPTSVDDDILVVVSKVKKYIVDKSGMNTSASTMDALTDRIKKICDRAIANARADGRKTVMDRDVPSS